MAESVGGSPIDADQRRHRLFPVVEGNPRGALQGGAVLVLVQVVLLPKDEQIAEVPEQPQADVAAGFGQRQQVFRQLRLLVGEHEKDERRVEARDVLLRQILHVDQFDEAEEEVDLRVKVGDVGQKAALGDRVVGRQLLPMLEEVLQREDEGADEHVRVDQTAVHRVEELLRRRRLFVA